MVLPWRKLLPATFFWSCGNLCRVDTLYRRVGRGSGVRLEPSSFHFLALPRYTVVPAPHFRGQEEHPYALSWTVHVRIRVVTGFAYRGSPASRGRAMRIYKPCCRSIAAMACIWLLNLSGFSL